MTPGSALVGLLLVLGGGWYWFEAMSAKELARHAGRRRCDELGVTFLDDSVVLTRLRPRRDAGGRMSLYREYRFEFASDGGVRYGGRIALLGRRVTRLEMAPYRERGADQ